MADKFNPFTEETPELSGESKANQSSEDKPKEDSEQLKALKYGLDMLFNDANLSKKSDLSLGLIGALAQGMEFGLTFSNTPMLRLVENTLSLRVSKDRKGRQEAAKVLSSMSQLMRQSDEDDDPDKKVLDRLMGK